MTEAESRAVLSWISAHQGSLPANTRDADSLVQSYLRAKGYREDRYGNFLNPADANVRFHLKERVVNLQEKRGGEWRNVRSMDLIPYAVGLAKKAAELAGDSAIVEKADKKRTSIRAAKEKRATKAAQEVTKRTIWLYAMRRIAFEYPDLFRQNATRVQALSPEQAAEMMAKRDEYQAHAEKLIADGHLDWVQSDPFATADQPPLTPFFYEKTAVSWIETVDGVKYQITVKNRDKLRVTIEIGTHGGFAIDPTQFTIVGFSGNKEGDGGLSGTASVDRDTAEISAALVLIDTKQKRSGAGSRMINLWCKMMRGWRVNRWLVVGAGEEGLPFFEAMDRKGVARIIAPPEEQRRTSTGGVNLVMQCPAQRLPNPIYRAIDMVDGRKKNPVHDLSGHAHDEHQKYGWWNSSRKANPVEAPVSVEASPRDEDGMRELLTQILDDDVASFEAGDRPDYHGVWPIVIDANVSRPAVDADDDARFVFHDAVRTQIAVASSESLKLYCAYWQACLQRVPGSPEPNPQHYVLSRS